MAVKTRSAFRRATAVQVPTHKNKAAHYGQEIPGAGPSRITEPTATLPLNNEDEMVKATLPAKFVRLMGIALLAEAARPSELVLLADAATSIDVKDNNIVLLENVEVGEAARTKANATIKGKGKVTATKGRGKATAEKEKAKAKAKEAAAPRTKKAAALNTANTTASKVIEALLEGPVEEPPRTTGKRKRIDEPEPEPAAEVLVEMDVNNAPMPKRVRKPSRKASSPDNVAATFQPARTTIHRHK